MSDSSAYDHRTRRVGFAKLPELLTRPLRGRAAMNDWSDERSGPVDRRNFYKVEKWSKDGIRVVELLLAGTSLDNARRIFERTTQHRLRIRLTIRQRMRVLDEWPKPPPRWTPPSVA
jgi:hypothetical protein